MATMAPASDLATDRGIKSRTSGTTSRPLGQPLTSAAHSARRRHNCSQLIAAAAACLMSPGSELELPIGASAACEVSKLAGNAFSAVAGNQKRNSRVLRQLGCSYS